ncbi:MAG: hypothetical protein SFU21_04045 [Flavihumibacter sp.]|nr:hypothetical protein [Flavihumibacter sp.]
MPSVKKAKRTALKKASAAKAVKKTATKALLPLVKTHKLYIESCAFFPANSSDGYIDNFQSGRHTAVANRTLLTPIVLPVGAKLTSIRIHYTNTTVTTPIALFLRKHADRHCPSGEIEMSFINLPNSPFPPDNYLTVTDTTFPDAGKIKDRYLHYLEIPGTGDFGGGGRITIRGVSVVYKY